MPSSLHELITDMFGRQPELAAELLGGVLGVDLPSYRAARIEHAGLTDIVPTEYRADAVVTLTDGRLPVLAVVVEVQLRRDRDKRWSWPVYLATLRARTRCPTLLLVVCLDPAVALWCAEPIPLGHPGLQLVPLVLGPDQVPMVTDPGEAARIPELAVLSAMTHGGGPAGGAVLRALVEGLATVDVERGLLYADVVLAALPAAAQRHLEDLMATGTYEYQSEFARRYFFSGKAEGRAEGAAEGRAEAVLEILAARGVEVPADIREQIAACRDLAQLDVWVRRAATANATADLFA